MPHKQRGEEMFWLLTLPPHVSWPWRRRGKYKYMRQMRNTKCFQDEKYPGLVWGITKWVWDAKYVALVRSKVQNQVRNARLLPKETQSGFEMRNTHLLYEDIQSVFKIWNTRLSSAEQIQIGFEKEILALGWGNTKWFWDEKFSALVRVAGHDPWIGGQASALECTRYI